MKCVNHIDERFIAKDFDVQKSESASRYQSIYRYTDLGTPEPVRKRWIKSGK